MRDRQAFHRLMRHGLFGLLMAAVLFTIYILSMIATGNFHEVVKGEFYRSGQVNAGDLATYKQRYGIKTVINLRGENPNEEWYKAELAEANTQGLKLINYSISAKRELPFDQAWQLIHLMSAAEKPILVHCESGVDRTGLAAALYLAAVKRTDEMTAEMQLSLLYGHVPFGILPFYAMTRTFEKLEPSLGYFDS